MPSSVPPVIVVGGGQSGLAAASALSELRMPTVILEASDRPAGSWPRYYDSLRVFSPAGYSSMPGMPFPGDPEHYPSRDEVADYLERYAARLDTEIHTNIRVETIQQEGKRFLVFTGDGRTLRASGIVAASGSFSHPHIGVVSARPQSRQVRAAISWTVCRLPGGESAASRPGSRGRHRSGTRTSVEVIVDLFRRTVEASVKIVVVGEDPETWGNARRSSRFRSRLGRGRSKRPTLRT
jgi:2-polyprenyl-6-methoxyphenol hydroxylase-like FAD-dependent oxidoreductase